MEVVFIKKGYLRIETVDGTSKPVSDVLIQVYHTDMSKENCVFTAYTDQNGRIVDIELETPDISLSQFESSERPYAQYHVAVSKDGYDIEERRNVQVFPGTVSTLFIQLNNAKNDFQRRNVIIFEDHKLFRGEVSDDA